MSDRRRRQAFALSALFVIAICVLVWLFERPDPGSGTEAARPAEEGPLVVGEVTAPPARHGRAAEPGRGEVSAIIAAARRFSGAFARYEVGQIPTVVRREIDSSTTASFASTLLNAPPRMPQGIRPPPPPQVGSIRLSKPRAGQAVVTVVLRDADGEGSALTELLSGSGQVWRISSLG